MFKSLAEDVMKTASVRHALLLALVTNQPLLVVTGEESDVPACPGPGWVKFLDDELRWQAVEASSFVERSLPNRTLCRAYDGKAINVITSVDPLCHIVNAVQSVRPPEPLELPDFLGNAYDAVMNDGCTFDDSRLRTHVVMLLPGTELPESVRCRLVVSLDLRSHSPSAAKALLDTVIDADGLNSNNIAYMRAAHAEILKNIDKSYTNRINKAIRGTRPDTVEFMERVSIGIMPTFGLGASPRVAVNVLNVSIANAVIAGRNYARSSDIVDVFAKVVAHAIAWGASTPKTGVESTLTQIAEWAVSI